nr:MAG TPA: hypothetical protein [Caudoviricetes sp.]
MNYLSLYTMPSLKDITNDYVITKNDISTEGFSLKDIIKRLKELVLKIKNFIKNIFRKAIAGFKVLFHKLFGAHKQIEQIVEVVEPVDLVAVAKKVLVGDLDRTKFILNKDTSIINVEAFHKFADDLWEKVTDTNSVEEIREMHILPSDPNASYTVSEGMLDFPQGKIIESENEITKITEKDIKELLEFRRIKKLSIEISERGYPKQINEVEGVLNNILRKTDLTHDEAYLANHQMMAIFVLLRGKLAVSHSLLGLYRGIYTELRKGSVFNTPVPKNLKLVHLSKNGELDEVLLPRQPRSLGNFKDHFYQILPKRVSFSPTIEEAMYGIPMEVRSAQEVSYKMKALDLFVYEPIIEKDTMMIKEKYMKNNVSEWKYTHEVAITTSVKIKKKSLIRAYFLEDRTVNITSAFGGTDFDWMNTLLKVDVIEKY